MIAAAGVLDGARVLVVDPCPRELSVAVSVLRGLGAWAVGRPQVPGEPLPPAFRPDVLVVRAPIPFRALREAAESWGATPAYALPGTSTATGGALGELVLRLWSGSRRD